MIGDGRDTGPNEHLVLAATAIAKRRRSRHGHKIVAVDFPAGLTHHEADPGPRLRHSSAPFQFLAASFAVNKTVRARTRIGGKHLRLAMCSVVWHVSHPISRLERGGFHVTLRVAPTRSHLRQEVGRVFET